MNAHDGILVVVEDSQSSARARVVTHRVEESGDFGQSEASHSFLNFRKVSSHSFLVSQHANATDKEEKSIHGTDGREVLPYIVSCLCYENPSVPKQKWLPVRYENSIHHMPVTKKVSSEIFLQRSQ